MGEVSPTVDLPHVPNITSSFSQDSRYAGFLDDVRLAEMLLEGWLLQVCFAV
jgi:hypothetical protein